MLRMKKLRMPVKTILEMLLVVAMVTTLIVPTLSCGSGGADEEVVGVDASGGIIEGADGEAKVIIPVGAVAEEEDISVAAAEAPALTGGMATVGDAYEYGPAGKEFDRAVTVTLDYDASELPAGVTPADLLLCIVTEDGGFTPLDNIYVDTEAGTISGDTIHFSVVAVTFVEDEADLEVYPGGLNFGDVLIHTTATRTVTVANPTSSDIRITKLQVAPFAEEWADPFAGLSPAFSVAAQNQLPMTIAAGDNQEISVSFSPLLTGSYKANLLVSTADATMEIPMEGQGVLSIGLFGIVPNFHDFGGVRLAPAPADTAKSAFTVANNTDLDVTVNNVRIAPLLFSTGSFALVGPSPAGTTLKSLGGIAPLQASYTPETRNQEFGYILVQGTDTDGNPVGAVCLLQGHGISGVDIKVDPLDFGKVLVGETKTLNTTIYNTGTLDFNQTQYKTTDRAFNPAFAPNAVAPLAVGQSAPAPINFTPGKRGPYVGVVVNAAARIDKGWINSSAPVTGIGVDSYVSFSPNPVDFGIICVDETAEGPLTMTNVGDFPVKVVGVGTPKDPFSVENTPPVGTILAIGQSHTFTVKFAPTEEGIYSTGFIVMVEFDHDGKIYTDTYTVMFYGMAWECGEKKVGISVAPDIDFGDVLVGTEDEKTTTVTNDSEEVTHLFLPKGKPLVTGATYYVSGGRVFGPVAPQPVGLGAFINSEEVSVTFAPSARTTYDGTIQASGTVSGKAVSATASVTGRGVDAELTDNPSPVDFGEVCVGESKQIRVTVTNTGDFDLTVAGYEWPEDPFEVISTVPRNLALAIGESYEFNIEFTPPAEGTYNGEFVITVEFEYRGETYGGDTVGYLVGDGIICGPKPWEVYISAGSLSLITVPPCACPTWPSCGCGPGTFNFTAILWVVGDDPEPMPGATVTVQISGPGVDIEKNLTTNSQGQATTTFTGSTSGTYTVEVVDVTGEYDDREMDYYPDRNVVTEVSKSAP